MVVAPQDHFESNSVGAPEWFSRFQEILKRLLEHQVAISFGLVFAIPGLLNGEAFRKLIAHGVVGSKFKKTALDF